MKIHPLIHLLRPTHWIKNGAVVLPIIFAGRVCCFSSWVAIAVAFATFCMLSSAVYAINDIFDVEQDRLHPEKRRRPIASGEVTTRLAWLIAGVLALTAMIVAYCYSLGLFVFAVAYLVMQLFYSFGLKHVVLLDVIMIAVGFVFRSSAGAMAIDVEISHWLFVCIFTMCLFMGFCKRYSEMVVLGELEIKQELRPTLRYYTADILTHLITLSAALALMGFIAWASNPETVARIGTDKLLYTFPVITYGTFRFAMVSMKGRYEGPVDIVLHDKPFAASIIVWCALAVAICNFCK